jgi:hypothetical protein
MNDHPTFEETYPKYPFSELVRIGIGAGTWILRFMCGRARRSEQPRAPIGDREVPAE